MIEALTMSAILFALAISGAVIVAAQLLRRAVRDRQPQRDEVQQLLTLLCEQLHDLLQQDGTPPRTVINLTAGQWHEVPKG
jgi:hypothetical protein